MSAVPTADRNPFREGNEKKNWRNRSMSTSMSMSMSRGDSEGTFKRFRIDRMFGHVRRTSLVILDGGDGMYQQVREWDYAHALHMLWIARRNGIEGSVLDLRLCDNPPESGAGTVWSPDPLDIYEMLPWNREPFKSAREQWYTEEAEKVATELSLMAVGETRPLYVEGACVGDVSRLEDGIGFTEEDGE